jgi:hypothetical protein
MKGRIFSPLRIEYYMLCKMRHTSSGGDGEQRAPSVLHEAVWAAMKQRGRGQSLYDGLESIPAFESFTIKSTSGDGGGCPAPTVTWSKYGSNSRGM